MIPALVQDILVALVVGAAVVALVSRFVVHRRVRRCPSCPAEPTRAVGRGIRAKGLDVVS